jgi:hypothetical protein
MARPAGPIKCTQRIILLLQKPHVRVNVFVEEPAAPHAPDVFVEDVDQGAPGSHGQGLGHAL